MDNMEQVFLPQNKNGEWLTCNMVSIYDEN